MKTSKSRKHFARLPARLLALLLAALTLGAAVPGALAAEVGGIEPAPAGWVDPSEVDPPADPSLFAMSEEERAAAAAAEGTPSAFSLVGTSELPPITNQGGIGSCASEGIAYMQFSNAVAHYLHAAAPGLLWNPSSGDENQIFSAKWAYTFSGPTNEGVYDVLQDMGDVPIALCDFYRDTTGAAQFKRGNSYVRDSMSWDVGNDNMQTALAARLKNQYVSYNLGGNASSNWDTSESGQLVISKVKEALLRGNTVTISGYPDKWMYGHLTTGGRIGHVGDQTIVAGVNVTSGAHTISIVGYDDEITCKVGAQTLTGGFLIANSWGTGWGTNGYTWVMYDALSLVSQYDELNGTGFYTNDMYLDSILHEDGSRSVVMNPPYIASADQSVTFTKAGTVTVNTVEYTTYNLKSEALGGYLAYDIEGTPDVSNTALHIEQEPGENTAWAFIPYETVTTFPGTNEELIDESYNGSYWVYAAGRAEAGSSGYAYLDAGTSPTSIGRSVGIASHAGTNYPQAKSWYVGDFEANKDKESFSTDLGIFAKRGTSSRRSYPFYAVYLTYWDEDITLERPELYLKMEVKTDNREALSILVVRQPKDKTGMTEGVESSSPAFNAYNYMNPDYDIEGAWTAEGTKIDFSGRINETARQTKATLYIPVSNLFTLNEGEKLSDFRYGVQLGARKKAVVTYSDLQLLSRDGSVLADLTFPDGTKSLTLDASEMPRMTDIQKAEIFNNFFPDEAVPTGTYTPELTLPLGVTVTDATVGDLPYGGSYSFKLNIPDGYNAELLTVTSNGVPLLASDGIYTTTLTDNAKIEVTGVLRNDLVADVDGSGTTDITDVTILLGYLGLATEIPEGVNADLSGDGVFTTKDVTRALAFLTDGATPLHQQKPRY